MWVKYNFLIKKWMRVLSFCFDSGRRSLCGVLSYYTRGMAKVAFSKNKNKRGGVEAEIQRLSWACTMKRINNIGP